MAMSRKNKKAKFVFTKIDIQSPKGDTVSKNDVGIIEKELKKSFHIFFIRSWKKTKVKKEDVVFFDVNKTGDGFKKKICNVCHKLLNTTHFDKNQNAKNNRPVRRPSCRDCRKHIDGVPINPKERKEFLKTKPNKAPFKCPICHKQTIAGVTSKIVIDHNHITGKIRNWICDSCNTGIGRFKDDESILRRAIRFIKQK